MVDMVKNSQKKYGRLILVIVNILLILAAVFSSLIYSDHIRKEKTQMEVDAFCSTIEGMKQVSVRYLEMEKGYAANWADYIESQNMTMDEALEYIKESNSQKDRYAHIVDMDTYEAHSTYEKNGDNSVHCYEEFKSVGTLTDQIFLKNMDQMFDSEANSINVLGKYKVKEAQITVVSVGTRVTLRTEGNDTKDYLLLRVIPMESMRNIWVFPVEYTAAEVGMITQNGNYVIQSASMKAYNFLEFIRTYNFENDYNRVNDLEKRLLTTKEGLMEYQDSKGEECYWYYSAFDDDSGLDILGCIPVSALNTHTSNWIAVFLTCGILLLLVLIDGAYILNINRKLRETVAGAEFANQAKTRFLSSMSHDIRTPMNAVIGMTDIARKYADDPEKVRECLDKVSLASSHLLTLINDILDISRIESGNMVLNPALFSVKDLTEKLVNIVLPQIEKKELEFIHDIDNFKYEYLVADELRLNQIFINLLNNAVKYTRPGGKVKLEIHEEIILEDSSKIRLVCRIVDTGIGMSEEFQKTMYNSFERATDSRINKIQGSGLGLAIAKEMVELMDGTIVCRSELGKGTEFTVMLELPVVYGTVSRKEESVAGENSRKDRESVAGSTRLKGSVENVAENEADRFKGMKVLVAEDNDLNWEILCELLGEHGVLCDRAENGQECVKMISAAEDDTYDLIFMDVQMPVMNGRDATREIRKSARKYVRNITVVAITADAFAEDMKECMEAGMNGHISKPVDIRKVLNILEKVQRIKENDRRSTGER